VLPRAIEWMLAAVIGTGQVELVKRLLDLEVDCSQADRNLWTPLHYAAANGHKVCVRSLLDAGVSAGDVDAWGRTPLHWAAERGWTDTVTLLVPAMTLEGRDVGLQVSGSGICIDDRAARDNTNEVPASVWRITACLICKVQTQPRHGSTVTSV
jgi:hypothetical protein